MLWLIRLGAYMLSGAVIWSFLHDGTGPVAYFPGGRHLVLDPDNGMVFGVCAGLGKYTGFDTTFIRLGWVLACLYRGVGVALYLLAFLLMPL
ncbi:PspC domain-containing protein [Anaeroselena agilis]|uniref:PspC domain-containing protein n=1 Tax=Anaeroselena agilis TaxID=3063788 RepID=A0ABU3P266_9FIRM|nr:PspC domain-containing protein [Selenomonadales bacterium 4137-cl]